MAYSVQAWTYFEPDENLPDGRLYWKKQVFRSLTAAREFAHKLMEAMPDSDSVIEVRGNRGELKYRVEKRPGTRPKFPLVSNIGTHLNLSSN